MSAQKESATPTPPQRPYPRKRARVSWPSRREGSSPPETSDNKKDQRSFSPSRSRSPRKSRKLQDVLALTEMLQTLQLSCHICQKDIAFPQTAFLLEGSPVHFSCVVNKLRQEESLTGKQELMYIGSGRFAVVEMISPKRGQFHIIREIPVETRSTEESSLSFRTKIQQFVTTLTQL